MKRCRPNNVAQRSLKQETAVARCIILDGANPGNSAGTLFEESRSLQVNDDGLFCQGGKWLACSRHGAIGAAMQDRTSRICGASWAKTISVFIQVHFVAANGYPKLSVQVHLASVTCLLRLALRTPSLQLLV